MSFVVPNWRSEGEYPYVSAHPDLAFWTWQFLRRNRHYQLEWEKFAGELQTLADRVPELRMLVARRLSPDWWPFTPENKGFPKQLARHAPDLMVPALPDRLGFLAVDTAVQPESIGHRTEEATEPLDVMLGRKWGLAWIQDPGSSMTGDDFGAIFLRYGGTIDLVGRENPYFGAHHVLTPAIDLRLPAEVLRAQFEFMLKYRESEIDSGRLLPLEGRPERQKSNFPVYLRVLDARDCGETIAEIARVLLPYKDDTDGRKSVQNWSKAAEKLRAESFRDLPLYAAIESRKF